MKNGNKERKYDAAGNLVEKPDGTKYTYDIEGRLSKITKNDGGVVEVQYDSNGKRIKKWMIPWLWRF